MYSITVMATAEPGNSSARFRKGSAMRLRSSGEEMRNMVQRPKPYGGT